LLSKTARPIRPVSPSATLSSRPSTSCAMPFMASGITPSHLKTLRHPRLGSYLRMSPKHQLVAFRLVGSKNARDKAEALRNKSRPIYVQQITFATIPESPLCYWLGNSWLNLLTHAERLDSVAFVREGLHTTNNLRFLRCFWECLATQGRWIPYVKGG